MHEQVRVAFSQLKAAVACRNLLQLLLVTWGPSASTLSVSIMEEGFQTANQMSLLMRTPSEGFWLIATLGPAHGKYQQRK